MTSRLGCHWIRVHPDGRDLDHIAKMQYPSVKLFEWHWSNRDACRDLLAVLPKDAYILARDHPLSEQEIWSDPEGIGIRQANEWAMKVAGGNYHLPVERTFFLGRNEPDATSGDRNAIDIYTEAFLNRLKVHGLRGGAFNFSTGHPRTVDGTGNTRADYTVFERSHQAILNGQHIGVLHIYGTANVPCAPGHYDRLRACPWTDVEWVVGEAGIDQHVIGGGNHDGYLRALSNPADYCRWLDEFIMGINDKRIHSYQVFTYDFSHPWDSFDTRPIRDALESYDWQHVKQPPIAVGDGPTPPAKVTPLSVRVVTTVAANIRKAPSLDAGVIKVMPAGTRLNVIGETGEWYQAIGGGADLWMVSEVFYVHKSVVEPVAVLTPPAPAPVASGILDPQVLEAILAVESGGRAFGPDGGLLIRFEAHVFVGRGGNTRHFRYNGQTPWTDQQWRRSEGDPWRNIHTGNQDDEYAAFSFAVSQGREAAHQSISMGAPQIMGFNHARIGYPSADAMFDAFQRSINAQLIGFINFLLADPALVAAIKSKDFRTVAAKYNGSGQIELYAGLMQKAYQKVVGA